MRDDHIYSTGVMPFFSSLKRVVEGYYLLGGEEWVIMLRLKIIGEYFSYLFVLFYLLSELFFLLLLLL